MHFINHLGKKGTEFLHAGGKTASDYLLQQILDLKPSSLLEIGSGTGATIVQLANQGITTLVATDISSSQLKQSEKRFMHCGVQDQIKLQLISNGKSLPFENNSFDVVFAESVFGILNEMEFIFLVKEVRRVLKPSGVFFTNDSIWKKGTSLETIRKINNQNLKDFGLIQSIDSFVGIAEWIRIFQENGFNTIKTQDIRKIETIAFENEITIKSQAFSKQQRNLLLRNFSGLMTDLHYKFKLRFRHKMDANNLEHYLICSR